MQAPLAAFQVVHRTSNHQELRHFQVENFRHFHHQVFREIQVLDEKLEELQYFQRRNHHNDKEYQENQEFHDFHLLRIHDKLHHEKSGLHLR